MAAARRRKHGLRTPHEQAAMLAMVGRYLVVALLASVPVHAADPVLEYEVADAKTHRVLQTLRGWTEDDGDPAAPVTAVSRVIFPRGNQLEVHALFTRDQPPRCLSWHAEARNQSGAVVAAAQEQMVQDAFPFLEKPVPANTYPALAPLGYLLTRLGLGAQCDEASFNFILMGSSLLKMDLAVDGRERVEVPAGSFDTYRVRMKVNAESLFPNLPAFLRPFVSFFIPVHTLWLTASAPQELVKYTGQMGPPGSPELVIRLMRIGDAAAQ